MIWIRLAQNEDLWRAVTSTMTYLHETPWSVVLKGTMPTERPPLVGEVSANFS
jgi:hypothetical protein